MRRILIAMLGVALLTGTVLAVRGAAADRPAPPAQAAAATAAAGHRHAAAATSGGGGKGLANQLVKARLATAVDHQPAGRQGRRLPDHHPHHPRHGLPLPQPRHPGLRRHQAPHPGLRAPRRLLQLGALEWVFASTPTTPPLPGATYGSFGAACHYKDGTFEFVAAQDDCAKRSPETGAAFNFWHPDLVTLHIWLWYPNPDGLYNGTNPWIKPYNRG